MMSRAIVALFAGALAWKAIVTLFTSVGNLVWPAMLPSKSSVYSLPKCSPQDCWSALWQTWHSGLLPLGSFADSHALFGSLLPRG